MKLSLRERWGLAALVPVLLAGAYLGFVRPPFEERQRIASRALVEAAPSRPDSGPGVAVLERQLDADLRRETELTRRRLVLLDRWCRPEARPWALDAVAALAKRRGLHVESAVDTKKTPSASVAVPPVLKELERSMAELGAGAPSLWRVEFRAPYAALAAALSDLAAADGIALPVTISASRREGTEDLSVVLWLWI